MKHRIMRSFAVIATLFMLTLPSPAAGRHPAIQDAIGALRNAKAHLEQAKHDFGGHRVDAIHAIDEATRQLEICMQY